MRSRKNLNQRRRRSRLNKYILILALLWIAATVALLVEAKPSHARVTPYPHSNTDHMAILAPLSR